MKVVFFNHHHNGDIHVARSFVREIMKKEPNVSFSFTHKNSRNLLADIPSLKYDANSINTIKDEQISLFNKGDTYYFNTWYCQSQYKYYRMYGLTLDALYAAFDNNCKNLWGWSLKDISSDPSIFIPTIDYSKFQIENAKSWIDDHLEKKIFVSNGKVLSGQAAPFELTSMIIDIANKHTDKTFILSNKENDKKLPNNVVYSSDLIKKEGCDLNENAFLTEHCDLIVGKASGALTFSLNQVNLLKRNVKLLNFVTLQSVVPKQGKLWLDNLLFDKINYSANTITSTEQDANKIKQLIEENL
ncbi:MAG TPA: hypothetical protein VII94_00825 [Candidatus Saccharimonadales bacterium]